MERVYDSLTEQYDLRLVVLAALICIATCLISMNLFVRANDAARDRPLPWLFVAATILGAGVWATNFIAELAYEPGFPIGYDAGLTAISFLAAIGTVWLGMSVVHRYADPEEGGAMIGAGIAAMHYIGMAALRAPAQLHWNTGYVLASIAIAMTFAAAAMRVLLRGPDLGGRLMAGAAHPGDCRTSFHGHGGSNFCAGSAYRGARPCHRPKHPRHRDCYGNSSHRRARPTGRDRG
jgi:NO-binding membrane sensor protein with MHYT domain